MNPLEQIKQQIVEQIERLQAAYSALDGLELEPDTPKTVVKEQKKASPMTPERREALSRAMKRRWAAAKRANTRTNATQKPAKAAKKR